jgi:hypothetical protein
MAYTTIKKPSDYFNTKLYTGTGATQSITGVGFQPDWVWIKQRDTIRFHYIFDSIRGATKKLHSNSTDAESTLSTTLTSFDSDGYTVETDAGVNQSSGTYASWNWLASNTTASNTDGSIASTVSVNTTSGFSIVSYTGNGTGGATVGHGLGIVPKWYFVKRRDSGTSNWHVYHASNAPTEDIRLNLAEAVFTTNIWNDTAPTSSVFSLGSSVDVNASGGTYIAYCFSEVKGFSKFGSYTGNGNADGTFTYLGFKPAFVIIKQTNAAGENWFICDNKRAGYNAENNRLMPNLTTAEQLDSPIDILSNGFKARETGAKVNASGSTYIYMAFAEEPLVGDNPATAR